MRIKTQYILTMILFGIMLAVIAMSVIVTNQRVRDTNVRSVIASSLERETFDLSYLSNDYLLYHEPQQLARWESKFTSFSSNLQLLKPETPEQQAITNHMKTNSLRLRSVFDEVAAALGAGNSGGGTPDDEFIHVSWSRMEVQNQGLIFDASRLSELLRAQEDRLKQANRTLTFVLMGVFAAFLVANYVLTHRRILRSMAVLREGARIIGSGNLDHSIEAGRNDEVGELSRAFNQMAVNLKEVTASKEDMEREMAERKRAEQGLKESEEKYRSLFDNMAEEVHFWKLERDDKGRIATWRLVDANPSTMKSWGKKSVEYIKGKTTDEIFGPGSTEHFMPVVQKIMTEGVPHSYEDYLPNLEKHFRFTSVPLGDHFITTGADITGIKHAEESIRRQAVELQAANKELEGFCYSVSHDLRAPLRSLSGFSQAIMEDYADKLDDQGKKYLQTICNSSQLMGRLIDDLLDLSRITRAPLRQERVDLSALAQEVAEELQQEQPQRQVEFVIEPRLEANGDGRMLKLVFQNLLGNAFKFTGGRPQARIEFGAIERNGERAYYVRDNGAGFDMKYAHKLFQPFQRLHSVDEFPGTGVGLASVLRIISRQGGRVWAEGEADNGATFYFTLRADVDNHKLP